MVGGAYKLCVCFRMFYRVGVLKSPRAFTIGRFSLHESDVYAARNDISSSFDMKKKKEKKEIRWTTDNTEHWRPNSRRPEFARNYSVYLYNVDKHNTILNTKHEQSHFFFFVRFSSFLNNFTINDGKITSLLLLLFY